mmetsp:Transcript_120277/g.208781  ORF Transcript_120277/g.208781 Transcript_120277/m.208781 type:complete len:434 (-) Transcript_120277:68-1369(-)
MGTSCSQTCVRPSDLGQACEYVSVDARHPIRRSSKGHANHAKVFPMPIMESQLAWPEGNLEPLNLTMMFVECLPPLLAEIVEYLAHSPDDLFHLLGTMHGVRKALHEYWAQLYASRWPAFAEATRFQCCLNGLLGKPSFAEGVTSWKDLYLATLTGRHECVLEVFDREKRNGFAMSAWPARMRYETSSSSYVAQYISAGVAKSEQIDGSEGYRLRFCPAREQLISKATKTGGAAPLRCKQGTRTTFMLPNEMQDSDSDGKTSSSSSGPAVGSFFGRLRRPSVSSTIRGAFSRASSCSDPTPAPVAEEKPEAETEGDYPYKVLEGIQDLQVGRPVELQWKLNEQSPFGWWYGNLESLRRDDDGRRATATLTFRHFPRCSRWYRLEVVFGDAEIRPCAFGGKTGGIRAVNEEDFKQWSKTHYFKRFIAGEEKFSE